MKNGIVLAISFLLVFSSFIAGPSLKATPQLGVSPNDYMTYGDIFFATNSTSSLPGGGPGGISHVSSVNDTVVSATITDVKLSQTYTFDNGTNPRTTILEGDLTTGTGNLAIFLVLGNLLPGDPVSIGGMVSPSAAAHINATVSRYYAGQVRPVNVVSFGSSGSGFSSSASLYWDQASGLLVEASANFTLPAGAPYATSATSFSYRVRATATNVWTAFTSPDYTLDLLLDQSTTIHQGDVGTFNVSITGYNGFAGTVSLQSSLSIVNATASNPPTVIIAVPINAAGQPAGASQLRVSTSTSTAPGLYLIDVNGSVTSGPTHYAIIAIEVVPPDFSLRGPSTVDVDAGTTVSVTLSVKAEGAFTSSVSIAQLYPSLKVQLKFNTTTAQLSPGVTVHVQLNITAQPNTIPGPDSVYLIGASQGASHLLFISVTVKPTPVMPDFTIDTSTSSLTINTSQTADFSVMIDGVNGFAGTIYVFVYESSYDQSVTCNATPNAVILTSTMTGALSDVTCHASTPGTYTIDVTGTYQANPKSKTVTLTVTSPPPPIPDFDVSATNPNTVQTGVSTASTITIAGSNGFSGTVDLKVTHIQTGLTCQAISPTSISSSGSASISCSSNNPGTYTVTVTAMSGSIVRTTTFQVTVQAKPSNAATFLGLDPVSFAGLIGGIATIIAVGLGLFAVRRSRGSSARPENAPVEAPPAGPAPGAT